MNILATLPAVATFAIGGSTTLGCRSNAAGPGDTDISATVSPTVAPGEPLLALAGPPHLDARRVALGRRLFFEPLLSRDGSTSCSNCHVLERGGADGRPLAIGIGNAVGNVNTPTVFNAALNFRQFWDGHASSLEEQIDGPINNPREMDSSYDQSLAKLERDPSGPSWAREVRAAYGTERLTAALMRDAIATYERSLVLVGSRFDQFLAGDQSSLDEGERRGYELFKSYGCASCHQGANVGGNMFERLGAARDYFDTINPSVADLGRYNVTHREADRYVFRVPSLRVVTLTAPYFHNGSIQTLDQAIRIMARYQLGRELPAGDVTLIQRFLATLVGKLDGVTFASTR